MKRRTIRSLSTIASLLFGFIALTSFSVLPARSAPTAEVAKKCLTYSYRAYPYKRPGSAKGSNERQLFLNDCIAKNGQIPEPAAPQQH